MLTQDMPQDCKSAVVANVDSPPATREGFLWLHDEVALPLMRRSESLGRAYKVLDSANDLHIRLFGRASSHAIFNMACCLSLGASACAFPNDPAGRLLFDADASKKTGVGPQTGGAKVSSEKESTKYEALPPWWPEASRDQLAEARLDLATLMLEQALEAGFADRARLLLDLDLQALRDQRPKQFAAALKHVAPTMDEGGASATTTAAEASTSSSPPSSSPLSWSSAASTTSAPPGFTGGERPGARKAEPGQTCSRLSCCIAESGHDKTEFASDFHRAFSRRQSAASAVEAASALAEHIHWQPTRPRDRPHDHASRADARLRRRSEVGLDTAMFYMHCAAQCVMTDFLPLVA